MLQLSADVNKRYQQIGKIAFSQIETTDNGQAQ
jgi:hypothetical protein